MREPVAWHGPIVMTTHEELQTAFRELNAGAFVKTGAEGFGNKRREGRVICLSIFEGWWPLSVPDLMVLKSLNNFIGASAPDHGLCYFREGLPKGALEKAKYKFKEKGWAQTLC